MIDSAICLREVLLQGIFTRGVQEICVLMQGYFKIKIAVVYEWSLNALF